MNRHRSPQEMTNHNKFSEPEFLIRGIERRCTADDLVRRATAKRDSFEQDNSQQTRQNFAEMGFKEIMPETAHYSSTLQS